MSVPLHMEKLRYRYGGRVEVGVKLFDQSSVCQKHLRKICSLQKRPLRREVFLSS